MKFFFGATHPTSFRAVKINSDTTFALLQNDFVITEPTTIFVTAVQQLALVFGDLDVNLMKCFERLFHHVIREGEYKIFEWPFRTGSRDYKVIRLTLWRPQQAQGVHDGLCTIARLARVTEVVFVCHSINNDGFLMGNGTVPILNLYDVSPLLVQYIVFFKLKTCFAPNLNYIRAVAEGRDQPLLQTMETMGQTSGQLSAQRALHEVVLLLREKNIPCDTSVLAGILDFDFYLDKWAWPHTTQEGPAGSHQLVRVKEQFGETFHIAVLVAVFPDILGKFKEPKQGPPALNDKSMNLEQYVYLQGVQAEAYCAEECCLLSKSTQEFIAAQTAYGHNEGTDLLYRAVQQSHVPPSKIIERVRRRMLGFKHVAVSQTVVPYMMLVIRISTSGRDTNSNTRDTPEALIIGFLNEFSNIVVVGNAVPAHIKAMFSHRKDIVYETELWNRTPPGSNKYWFQLCYYHNMRIKYSICHALGLWSSQLDMYALLGITVLRIALKASYVARIRKWSEALTIPFAHIVFSDGVLEIERTLQIFTQLAR